MLQIQETLLKQELLLIVYFIAVLLFFIIFAIVFVVAFQRRKNKFLVERLKENQKFEKELANAQIEIQEQVFKNIAWELHDNIGQLLSVVNIQLNMLLDKTPEKHHEQIKETKTLVSEIVQEIRNLSKVLNNDVVLKNGLLTSLNLEIARFNKMNFLQATCMVSGDIIPIKSSNEIIIFRILQEFLSNIIKHARAKKLTVLLDYKENALEITASDDGVGFNSNKITQNSGMETMRSRAALLKADFSITSEPGKGTTLYLHYPYGN